MPDIDQALAAFVRLDKDGRKALGLCTLELCERLNAVTRQAQKSEYLLGRLLKWASDWGLSFDLGPASQHWDFEHPQAPPAIGLWLEERVAAQGEELSQMRAQLAEAIERAEAAEARLQEFAIEPAG